MKRNSSRLIQLEQYRRLVAKSAWRAWKSLPIQFQVWIGIDDMIEDGMFYAYKFLTKRYNPDLAKFSTGLYHELHNFYIRRYIEQYGSQKSGWHRVDGKLVPIRVHSIQGMVEDKKENGNEMAPESFIPSLVESPESIIQNVFTECFVVPALGRVYDNASEHLREEMVNWFWFKQNIHTHGKPFVKAAKEFRKLCKEENIWSDDCLHLVRSPKCLDSLSRQILHIPYDINCPCPSVDRIL